MFNKTLNYPISLLSGTDIEYGLLENKPKQQIPKMSFPLKHSKKYIMIEEFRDEIRGSKNALNEKKMVESFRAPGINEIKRKLNMIHDEINDIVKKLGVDLTTLQLRPKFLEKLHLSLPYFRFSIFSSLDKFLYLSLACSLNLSLSVLQ